MNSFLVKIWCFMTPGGLLGAGYTPLVVRYRPGHLNMTHGSPKSWYQQSADLHEVIQKRYVRLARGNRWFLGVVEKKAKMACRFLQCKDMVRTCYRSKFGLGLPYISAFESQVLSWGITEISGKRWFFTKIEISKLYGGALRWIFVRS